MYGSQEQRVCISSPQGTGSFRRAVVQARVGHSDRSSVVRSLIIISPVVTELMKVRL